MPENENKKEQGKEPALGLSKVKTADNMVGKAVVQGPSETEKTITKTYDSNIKNMETTIKGLEGARKNAVNNDATAQRRARNMQTIAGISDSLASLANLIGVGKGGTNIDMGEGALTPLQQKAEAARLERKADIKSIDDRLEQYRRQLDQMRMQKGLAVAQQKQEEAKQAFTRSERWANQNFQKKLTEMQIAANERLAQKELESKEKIASEENQSRENIANINAGTKNPTGEKAIRPVVLINEDGSTTNLTLTKGQYTAIMDRFDDIIKQDGLESREVTHTDPDTGETYTTEEYDTSTPIGKAYSEYLEAERKHRNGKVSDKFLDDKRNAVINASPTMRKMLTEAASATNKWGQFAITE